MRVKVSYVSIEPKIDPKSTEYLPTFLVEPYGKISENERKLAQQTHKNYLGSSSQNQVQHQVGQSFKVHTISDKAAKELRYLPT